MNLKRRGLLGGILAGTSALGIASSPGVWAVSPTGANPEKGFGLDVTDFGAVGDGESPCYAAFQAAIDAVEAAGGGIVRIPAGTFVLERTPLIGTGVFVRGVGPATVLRGRRPEGGEGAALISNKGQQARGFEGAHDWGISHLAIDSPQTNGIVVTHADRVYIGFIHGIEAFHHFVDIVGRHVLCENLWLTGRSGTSSFQIDSLSGAQTIWDGTQAVPPLYDGTDARDVVLRHSVITAKAGHQGHRPRHHCSIHFHGDETAGFIFSDLILGGADVGFYQDEGTCYDDIQINNVRSYNPVSAVRFNGSRKLQKRLMIRGFNYRPEAKTSQNCLGFEVFGRRNVILSAIQIDATDVSLQQAVRLSGCRQALIQSLQAEASAGAGVLIEDWQNGDAHHLTRNVIVESSMFSGFDVGCESLLSESRDILARGNIFESVAQDYRGSLLTDVRSERDR